MLHFLLSLLEHCPVMYYQLQFLLQLAFRPHRPILLFAQRSPLPDCMMTWRSCGTVPRQQVSTLNSDTKATPPPRIAKAAARSPRSVAASTMMMTLTTMTVLAQGTVRLTWLIMVQTLWCRSVVERARPPSWRTVSCLLCSLGTSALASDEAKARSRKVQRGVWHWMCLIPCRALRRHDRWWSSCTRVHCAKAMQSNRRITNMRTMQAHHCLLRRRHLHHPRHHHSHHLPCCTYRATMTSAVDTYSWATLRV